jgi:hypothetical protein
VIRKQKSNDLDVMTADLLEVLFRTENKFDLDSFLQQKYGAIQAIIEMTKQPKLVFLRIQDDEAALGDKILLM